MYQRVNKDTARHAGNDVGGVVEGSPATHVAQGRPMHSLKSDSHLPPQKASNLLASQPAAGTTPLSLQ